MRGLVRAGRRNKRLDNYNQGRGISRPFFIGKQEMTATLASMTRFLSVLNERESPETLREETREYLVSATLLINEYLGLNPEGGSEVSYIDTYAARGATAGLALPISDREPYPVIDLPVGGVLTGLQVRYRGNADIEYGDPSFSWDDIAPLTPREHYIYDEATGRVKLLFHPKTMLQGLEVRYGSSVGSMPDISIGDTLRTQQGSIAVQMDVESQEGAIRMFSGIDHKTGAESPPLIGFRSMMFGMLDTADGSLASVKLYAPRDVPVGPSGFGLMAWNDSTQQSQEMIGVDIMPKPADVYEVRYPHSDNVRDTTLVVQPIFDGRLVCQFSRIRLSFYHPTWRHLDGAVHPTLSQACAQLAKFLRAKDRNDGTGKTSDTSRRNYSSMGAIPRDIAIMLNGFQRRSSSVKFI